MKKRSVKKREKVNAKKIKAQKAKASPVLKAALVVPERHRIGKDARGLTPRENDFIRRFLKTPNGTKVMLELAKQEGVEILPSTAASDASEIINKPAVQNALAEALDKAGATDERVAKVLADGLDAYNVHEAVETGLARRPKEAKRLLPDFATRRTYVETIAKVKGHLKGDDVGAKIINYQSFKAKIGALPDEDD